MAYRYVFVLDGEFTNVVRCLDTELLPFYRDRLGLNCSVSVSFNIDKLVERAQEETDDILFLHVFNRKSFELVGKIITYVPDVVLKVFEIECDAYKVKDPHHNVITHPYGGKEE